MERCRVLRIEEQMYGCEELPEGAEVCCDVTVEAADGTRKTLSCPDAALIRQGIGEGDRVLWDGTELKKERNIMKKIETSALIGLGALGILFGRKMPGVKVIADAGRIARYSAQPVVCNGEECHFDYVTPEQGQPVDLVLVAVKATVLEQAIRDMKKFIGPDTIVLSVLNGITSEEDIEAVYPGHCLWSVAIGMDATRVGRSLTFGAPGRIQFGEKNGEMTDRVRAVDEYLTACGIASEPCSDILFKQWSKLMVNDGLNQAAAALRRPDHARPGLRQDARGHAGGHRPVGAGGGQPARRQPQGLPRVHGPHLQARRDAQYAAGRPRPAPHRGGGVRGRRPPSGEEARDAHPGQRFLLREDPGDRGQLQ